MSKSNNHLSFRKMKFLKISLLFIFNYTSHKKGQTFLSTSFIKCASSWGLSGTLSTAAQKSKEKLGQQKEDSINMNELFYPEYN